MRAKLLALLGLVAIASAGYAAGEQEMGGSELAAIHPTAATSSRDFWENGDFSSVQGTTVRYLTRGVSDYEQGVLDELERLTGIKVEYETYSHADLKNKVLLEFLAGGRGLDIFDFQTYLEGIKYNNAGFLEPLDTYINDSRVTDPDWDFNDFLAANRNAVTFGGETKGVPKSGDLNIFFYRSDLLQEAGLEVPQTFEEFAEAARVLSRDTDGDGSWDIFGAAMRAEYSLGHAGCWLFGFDGGFFDESGNIIVNGANSVAAMTNYVETLRAYGPPGVIPYEDTLAAFSSGRAALFVGPAGRMSRFINPESSEIIGKFGVTVVPAGPGGRREPLSTGYSYGMSSNSQNKLASWLVLQYITRPEVMIEKLKQGDPPPRASAWEQASQVLPSEMHQWAEAVLESAQISEGVSHVPGAIQGLEMRYVIEGKIAEAIEGKKTVEEALNEAAVEMEELIVPGEFD